MIDIRKIYSLIYNNVILSRVNCDVGGGRIYIANNSANKGGNTNITINAIPANNKTRAMVTKIPIIIHFLN